MEQIIKIFENVEFGRIRTVIKNGEPWLIGKDVADILKYRNGSRDINRHVDEEDRCNMTAIEYIRNGMKRVRKKESSFILASQNIEDFLLPEIKEFTKPLFSIPSHSFLFFPGNISPAEYMDALQLVESEYHLIQYAERGTCVYRCGNERYLLQVHAPAHKEIMFGKAGGR